MGKPKNARIGKPIVAPTLHAKGWSGTVPDRDTVIVVIMESERWTWVAIGRTKDEARDALRRKWNQHADTTWAAMTEIYDAPPDEYYAAEYTEMNVNGSCYRT